MGNDKSKKLNIRYWMPLALGFLVLVLPTIASVDWFSGCAVAIWLLAFVWLTCEYREKKQLVVTGLVFFAGTFIKYAGIAGLVWLGAILALITALAYYALFLAYSYLINRWRKMYVTLAMPFLWLGIYLLFTVVKFPSLVRLDMMFSDSSEAIQIESIIGSAGLSFLLVWGVALLCFAIQNHKIPAGVLALVLVLCIMAFGIVQLYPNTSYKESVKVAYTTGIYVGDFLNYTSEEYDECINSMEKSVLEAAKQGAEILVFNEEAFEMKDTEEASFVEKCCAEAKARNMHILMGLDLKDTDGSENGKSINKIFWVDQKGQVIGSYVKRHIIPVLESDYVRGDGIIPSNEITVGDRDIKISYLICYDSNFPDYVKQIPNDTEILFLPSWDWGAVTELHARLCRTLAVETGVSIVKPTYDGKTIITDPKGNVIKSTSTDDLGFENVQLVDVPLKSGGYTVTNNPVEPSAAAIIAVEILSMLICLVLIFGVCFENREVTERRKYYTLLVATIALALLADCFSWVLDGCENLETILKLTTTISMTIACLLPLEFMYFLMAFVKERHQVNLLPLKCLKIYTVIITVLTLVGCASGELYTFDKGVYADGALYGLYVVADIIPPIVSLAMIFGYREKLGRHDSLAAYLYVLIPIVNAAINIFVSEWSFVYPATTLSLVIVYTMMQSEEMVSLRAEGMKSSYNASHDRLTGLYNRLAYEEKLQELRKEDCDLGIVFADINGLKYTNDHYGHVAGDKLLVEFAKELVRSLRKSEIYRISGDEFVVLMEDVQKEVFDARTTNLKKNLDNDEMTIASVGAAYGSARNVNGLIKKAEVEMYKEKESFHKKYPKMAR